LKEIFFIFLCIIIFQIHFVSAEIQIQLEVKDKFLYGEEIYFNYTLSSNENIDTLVYTPFIYCNMSPNAMLVSETIQLNSGESYSKKYSHGVIDDSYYSEVCTATVLVEQPYEQIIKKNFIIITKKEILIDIKINKQIFIKNESIDIDYSSNVLDLLISTYLTYPDKTTQEITLPISIKAEQIGTYELEVTASKEGYKTITKKEQFGVIEEDPVIKSASECNANGICDINENYQNCPQDCLSEKDGSFIEPTQKYNWIFWLIGGILLIIILLIILLILKQRNFGEQNLKDNPSEPTQ